MIRDQFDNILGSKYKILGLNIQGSVDHVYDILTGSKTQISWDTPPRGTG